jgi:hypothetical protein
MVDYRCLALVDLIKLIVEDSDSIALSEFHENRTVFKFRDKSDLRFIEFLDELCGAIALSRDSGWNAEIDKVYNLTLERFSNLPGTTTIENPADSGRESRYESSKVDCRKYFSAFLTYISRSFDTDPPANQIEAELRAVKDLQTQVVRHFKHACLEAERSKNPLWTRYGWKTEGQTIYVFLPVSIKGLERRKWLEKNIKDSISGKLMDRHKVQDIINKKLGQIALVPLNDELKEHTDKGQTLEDNDNREFGISLGKVVAQEKAHNAQKLRRSIRQLGREKIRLLVMRIFKEIGSGTYADKEIAIEFGLSKATFSRFAGSRWFQNESAIPDLWLNTAKILSQNIKFREVVEEAGFLEVISAAARQGNSARKSAPK